MSDCLFGCATDRRMDDRRRGVVEDAVVVRCVEGGTAVIEGCAWDKVTIDAVMEGGEGVEGEGGWSTGRGLEFEARVDESWVTPEGEEPGRRSRIRAVEGDGAGMEVSGLGDLLAFKIVSPLRFPSV